MNFSRVIESMYVQDVVYWGNPQNNGFGTFSYDPPIALKCYWQEKEQILSNENEKAVISRAIVHLPQDVVLDGLLWLGKLDDLTTEEQNDPKSISGVVIIKRFEKTPLIRSTTVFLRKANVSPFLY